MDIVRLLQTTRDKTLPCYDLAPDQLLKTYAPGKWSIRVLLIHLSDVESVLLERIKRTLAEPTPQIRAFNQDLWVEHLDYGHFPMPLARFQYQACRDSMVYLAEKYYASLGQRTYIHSEMGVRTLKQEFDKVAAHNQAHLDHIHEALERG